MMILMMIPMMVIQSLPKIVHEIEPHFQKRNKFNAQISVSKID